MKNLKSDTTAITNKNLVSVQILDKLKEQYRNATDPIQSMKLSIAIKYIQSGIMPRSPIGLNTKEKGDNMT